MKLCIVSTCLSAVSTNARTSADEMPCASGELRGKETFPANDESMTANRMVTTTAKRIGEFMKDRLL
jgi:hypothetical protein